MNVLYWYYKRLYWKVRKYLDNHTCIPTNKKIYNGQKILSIEDTSEEIIRLMKSEKPFLVARLGSTELKAMVSCCEKNKFMKKYCDMLCLFAGFFGDVEDMKNYCELMKDSIHEVDLMGVWFNQMEDYILKQYGNEAIKYGLLEGLEPWYNPKKPWSSYLKGKKVLIIHPFVDSINENYKFRDKLFENSDILPEFELYTIKAVQTMCDETDDRFNTWFDALDYMHEEAMKINFDIAIVACGAYGLPLAAKIKQSGKSAIHLGGPLQLLFGIEGKRWENFEPLKPFINDYWKHPSSIEKPKNVDRNVEGGCYW